MKCSVCSAMQSREFTLLYISRDSKAYMQATSKCYRPGEKWAVILQEVVGNQYGDRYYPSMSGVARSLNYYPIGDEKAEEGIVNLALGLGKYIVDGGMTLRFSPYHPNQVLQTSEMEIALKRNPNTFLCTRSCVTPDMTSPLTMVSTY